MSNSALPLRLHHNAYVCADQERTRHFYEDIVGLPLLAAWIEEAEFPEFPGRRISYSHAFYGIGDGRVRRELDQQAVGVLDIDRLAVAVVDLAHR